MSEAYFQALNGSSRGLYVSGELVTRARKEWENPLTDTLVERALKPDIILLNIQCGANLTLLGLHKRVPTTNIVTKKTSIHRLLKRSNKNHNFFAKFNVGEN